VLAEKALAAALARIGRSDVEIIMTSQSSASRMVVLD